jgi:Flp pilus assembly pilin Flp
MTDSLGSTAPVLRGGASIRQLGLRLRDDARGLTTVEYTIVLCLIAALCVAAWKKFGDSVNGYIGQSTTELNDNLDKP